MKNLTDEQLNKVYNAIKSAHALINAGIEENGSTCGCYHINPFNRQWDEKTVKEVSLSVERYVHTWILSPLLEVFDINEIHLDAEIKIRRLENEIRALKAQMKKS